MPYSFKNLRLALKQIGDCEALVDPSSKTSFVDDQAGLCHGLACMFMQAFFANEVQVFWERLHFLCQGKWVLEKTKYDNLANVIVAAKNLISRQPMLASSPMFPTPASRFIDALIFIQNVMLCQGKIHHIISYQHVIKSSTYVMPQQHYAHQSNNTAQGLIRLYSGVDVFESPTALGATLDKLAQDINRFKNNHFKACLLIRSGSHAISYGLSYEGDKVNWKFFDQNVDFHFSSPRHIQALIFMGFTFGQILPLCLAIEIYTTPKALEDLMKRHPLSEFNPYFSYYANVIVKYFEHLHDKEMLLVLNDEKKILNEKLKDLGIEISHNINMSYEALFNAHELIVDFLMRVVRLLKQQSLPIPNWINIIANFNINLYRYIQSDIEEIYATIKHYHRQLSPTFFETFPFHLACAYGCIDAVRELLSVTKININQQNVRKTSPLYIASQNGHTTVVELLLKDPRIDVNQAYEGATPFYVASQNGHTTVVELLLKDPRIDVNQAYEGTTPLFIACQKGHADVVSLLLNFVPLFNGKPININQPTTDGRTPLDIARYYRHHKIVKLLEDFNQKNSAVHTQPTANSVI